MTVNVIDKNRTYHFDLFSCGFFSELMNPFVNGNKPFFGEIQVQICSLAEKNYEKNSSVGFFKLIQPKNVWLTMSEIEYTLPWRVGRTMHQ